MDSFQWPQWPQWPSKGSKGSKGTAHHSPATPRPFQLILAGTAVVKAWAIAIAAIAALDPAGEPQNRSKSIDVPNAHWLVD